LKDKAWTEDILGKTMLRRLGQPEEVAWVALFLSQPMKVLS
jgi:hypothetical protein